MRRTTQRGFTIVELLVALGVGTIVLTLVYQIFITQRRGYSLQEEVGESQQNARVAAEELARLIKSIGNGVDRDQDQPQLLYCGPFDLAYNSDMDTSRGPVNNALTFDSIYYGTTGIENKGATAYASDPGAETHQLSLSQRGSSRHYDLVRETSWDDSGTTETETTVVASYFNYKDSGGNDATPLFLYWGDFDGDDAPDLWGDSNDDGDILDSGELATALTEVSVAGRSLDEVIQRVEIQVRTETRHTDPNYADNSGYRVTEVRSDVTPRNLFACPRFDLVADYSHTVDDITDASGSGQSLTYDFKVLNNGVAEAGRLVTFALANAAGDTVTAIQAGSSSDVTDSSGTASTTIDWGSCAALLAAMGSGSASYTLSATIGNSPPLTTPLGACTAETDASTITITPGAPHHVDIVGPTPSTILTCMAPQSFTFTGTSYDRCDNLVDPDGLFAFRALVDGSVAPGTISPSAVFPLGSNPQVFTFQPDASSYPLAGSSSWPITIEEDDTTGSSMDLDPAIGIGATLEAWPPDSLAWTPSGTAAAVADCPDPAVTDYFEVLDCEGHIITRELDNVPSADISTYKVTATFDEDGAGPTSGTAPQGVLTSSNNADLSSIQNFSATGTGTDYDLVYTPPTCTLDNLSASISSLSPEITLELMQDGSSMSPAVIETNNATLQPCLDSCTVTASISGTPITSITECQTPAVIDLEISRCDLDGGEIQLDFDWTQGGSGVTDAYLEDALGNRAGKGSTLAVPLSGTNPSLAEASMVVAKGYDGDAFSISAYYLDANGTERWRCTELTIPVANNCGDTLGTSWAADGVRICADDACTQDIVAGSNDCASAIGPVIYFKVDDCRFDTSTLSGALTVTLEGKTSGYSDVETVDLTPGTLSGDAVLEGEINVFQLASATAGDGYLTYPEGDTITITATYQDPNASSDTCSEDTSITGPLPMCFPNAITSGGGAGWRGNFDVHWGDVVVRGNVNLPSHYVEKKRTGMFNGNRYTSTYTDRFVDIYVGKSFVGDPATGNFVGLANPSHLVLDQPFIGSSYGNYFRNISYDKITEMIVELDYEWTKELAQDRGVYWYTLPGGDIRNPDHDSLIALGVSSSDLEFSLQELLEVPGAGLEHTETVTDASGTSHEVIVHDGDFIFIDTYGTASAAPSYTGAQIDAMALGSFPTHTINGNFFTEGIIYVAGNVDFDGLGPRTTVAANTPPQYEIHYDHNDTSWLTSEDQLPVRSDPTESQASFSLNVHINGAFYADGTIAGNGNPSVYGSLTTERGYSGTGTPEIWYNYDLNVSGTDTGICVECCEIQVQPSTAVLEVGDTVNLSAIQASGAVEWFSNDTSVATVGASSGVVTAVSLGSVGIGARDHNNCVDFATITVVPPCFGFAVDPASATIKVGESQSFTTSNADAGATLAWSLDDSAAPGSAAANPALTNTTVPGLYVVNALDAPGTVIIGASDVAGVCPSAAQDAFLHVSCPDINVYLDSTSIGLGTGATASLAPGADDPTSLSLTTTWSSTDTSVATVDAASGAVTSVAEGTTAIVATISSGCSYREGLEVTAPVCTLALAPASATVISGGGTTTLTASGALGSNPLVWASSDTSVATVNASGVVTGNVAGNATISAKDQYGCTASASITVSACSLTITPASPSVALGGTQALTASTPNPVSWGSSDPALVSVDAAGVVSALAPGTATITAKDTVTGCRGTAAVTATCSLSVSPDPLALGVGASDSLSAAAAIGGISWSSADSSVASVDASGSVTGVSAGATTISATDDAGCSYDVSTTVRSCTLAVSPANATVDAAASTTYSATGAYGGVTWSTGDITVATVNASGDVTGVSSGSTSVVAEDTIGCSDSATVEVCGLTINGPATLKKNNSTTLTAVDYRGAAGDVAWTLTTDFGAAYLTSGSGASTILVGGGPTSRGSTATITVTDGEGCSAGLSVRIVN